MSMYTDSHTHLNSPQLFPDYGKHIQDFLDAWWVWLSIIWTNLEDSMMGIEIVTDTRSLSNYNSKVLNIGVTIGYHPEFARDYDIEKMEELVINDREQNKIWTKQPMIIWIWEIGTDLYREPYHAFYEEQKKAFYDQCQLALKYNLPIIIHSRNDFAWTMEVLQSVSRDVSHTSSKPLYTSNSVYNTFKIYFHCRGYTTEELKTLNMFMKNNQNLELYIGFCGNISYPKAQELRESFQFCLDHNINVLIETDAPYLAAQAIRGQQNTPAKIIHTYEYISDYFHIPMDDLQKKTHDNFMSLYYPTDFIASEVTAVIAIPI